jgi:hypothetical protein
MSEQFKEGDKIRIKYTDKEGIVVKVIELKEVGYEKSPIFTAVVIAFERNKGEGLSGFNRMEAIYLTKNLEKI